MLSFHSNSNYQTQVTFDGEYDGGILLLKSQNFLSNIEAINRISYIRSCILHQIMSNEHIFSLFFYKVFMYEHE